jgi:hypothetical protein
MDMYTEITDAIQIPSIVGKTFGELEGVTFGDLDNTIFS